MKHQNLVIAASIAGALFAAGCQSTANKDAQPAPASSTSNPGDVFLSQGRNAPEAKPQDGSLPLGIPPFRDQTTGKMLQGYRKMQKMVMVRDGRLYNIAVHDEEGIPIVREDENYVYVEVPEAGKPAPKPAETKTASADLDYPLDEAEVVTPRPSKKVWKFADMSGGLPGTGQWRTNFDLFDMDGDGKPEIISPPPRLSTMPPQIFKFNPESKTWAPVKAHFNAPAGFNYGFGGIVVGDINKDGKPDMILGTHDGAINVAMNQGDWNFKIEPLGLPRKMAAQGLALVDLDRDGWLDLVAQSESPEKVDLTQDRIDALMTGGIADGTGYVKGFDARAFFWRDGKFVEDSKGLWSACWGYAISVLDRGPNQDPYYASSCRSTGFRMLLYRYDRAEKMFKVSGSPKDLIENFAVHQTARWGTYKGRPAAFVSYIKAGSDVAKVRISGDGLTVYYQKEDGNWERKRVLKRIIETGGKVGSPGLDVGDLDGDGLDDIVWADEKTGKIMIFFQTPSGEFEAAPEASLPVFANFASSLRIVDVDGDGKKDIVLMHHSLSESTTREGGFRVYRGLP